MKKIVAKPVTNNAKSTEVISKRTVKKSVNLMAVILGLLLLLVLAGGAYGYYRYGNIAIVNGKPISRIEYIQNLEKQGGKQVLDQMVQESLILDEAKKKGVVVDQSVIKGEVDKIDTQIKSQGQTLAEALTAQGMTQADLEKQIRIQQIVQQLAASNTEFTQQQIDDYLTQNKDQLPTGASKDELQTLAKTQLASQAKTSSITTWLANLEKDAKIIYK